MHDSAHMHIESVLAMLSSAWYTSVVAMSSLVVVAMVATTAAAPPKGGEVRLESGTRYAPRDSRSLHVRMR